MAELFLLRTQVVNVARPRLDLEWNALDDGHTVRSEPLDLLGIVRQQANLADTEVAQDLRPDAIITTILGEAELQVRLDRVASLILQRVRAHLVAKTDPATLLMEIQEDAL